MDVPIFAMCRCEFVLLMTVRSPGLQSQLWARTPECPVPPSPPPPESTWESSREGAGRCVRVAGRGEGPGSMIYRPLGRWG